MVADLCSLTDVKAWLRTGVDPFPPTDDAMLARLITSVSRTIDSWLARSIGLGNWQEIRYGLGGERRPCMVLAVTPILAILSLTIDDQVISAAPTATTLGYLFTPTTLELNGYRFARGSRVVIQYTAGEDPTASDLQQTAIEMVVRKYRERTRIGERSRSLGGAETVSYETMLFSPRDVTDIQENLWQHRAAAPLLRATPLPPAPIPLELEDTTTEIVLEDQQTPIVGEPG